MGAPGTVIGSDPTLNQPKPQPGADPPEAQKGLLDATCTAPVPSATANVMTSSRATTAVTGAPGVVVTLSAGLGWTDMDTAGGQAGGAGALPAISTMLTSNANSTNG